MQASVFLQSMFTESANWSMENLSSLKLSYQSWVKQARECVCVCVCVGGSLSVFVFACHCQKYDMAPRL